MKVLNIMKNGTSKTNLNTIYFFFFAKSLATTVFLFRLGTSGFELQSPNNCDITAKPQYTQIFL